MNEGVHHGVARWYVDTISQASVVHGVHGLFSYDRTTGVCVDGWMAWLDE